MDSLGSPAPEEPSTPLASNGAARWLRMTAAGTAATFIALYLFTALRRVTFPFDLDWGEGAFVDHVARLLKGHQLYVAPSLNFTPLVYTPGYHYASALAALVFGTSFTTLRAVSIVCSIGIFAVLLAFGRRERGSFGDGLVLAGMFAAT